LEKGGARFPNNNRSLDHWWYRETTASILGETRRRPSGCHETVLADVT